MRAPANAGVAYSSPRKIDGYAAGRDVTHHAAADAGQQTEHRCREDVEPRVVCLDCAGDAEQRQADGVEHHDLLLHPPDRGVEVEHQDRGRGRYDEISPVIQRRWRHRTDQHVAKHSAAESGDQRKHHDAEEVELLAYADQRTSGGKHRNSGKVEDQQEGVRHVDDRIWCRRVTAGSALCDPRMKTGPRERGPAPPHIGGDANARTRSRWTERGWTVPRRARHCHR